MAYVNSHSIYSTSFGTSVGQATATPINAAFNLGRRQASLRPDSFEANQVRGQIDMLIQRTGGVDAYGESPVATAAALGVIYQNLEPGSAEARDILMRIQELNILS